MKNNTTINDNDRAIIKIAYYKILAEWWGMLNDWKWPSELLPEESKEEHHLGRRSALMAAIEEKIGKRYCLRYHNKDMSEDEFEDFWQGTHGSDPEARRRYWTRLIHISSQGQ